VGLAVALDMVEPPESRFLDKGMLADMIQFLRHTMVLVVVVARAL
jgi:hypothetical protein